MKKKSIVLMIPSLTILMLTIAFGADDPSERAMELVSEYAQERKEEWLDSNVALRNLLGAMEDFVDSEKQNPDFPDHFFLLKKRLGTPPSPSEETLYFTLDLDGDEAITPIDHYLLQQYLNRVAFASGSEQILGQAFDPSRWELSETELKDHIERLKSNTAPENERILQETLAAHERSEEYQAKVHLWRPWISAYQVFLRYYRETYGFVPYLNEFPAVQDVEDLELIVQAWVHPDENGRAFIDRFDHSSAKMILLRESQRVLSSQDSASPSLSIRPIWSEVPPGLPGDADLNVRRAKLENQANRMATLLRRCYWVQTPAEVLPFSTSITEGESILMAAEGFFGRATSSPHFVGHPNFEKEGLFVWSRVPKTLEGLRTAAVVVTHNERSSFEFFRDKGLAFNLDDFLGWVGEAYPEEEEAIRDWANEPGDFPKEALLARKYQGSSSISYTVRSAAGALDAMSVQNLIALDVSWDGKISVAKDSPDLDIIRSLGDNIRTK